MTSRERLETAWSFREPDRVPIELELAPLVREQPEARWLVEFVDTQADNFLGCGWFPWGFMGIEAQFREEVIEEVPGAFKRVRRTASTPVGEFFGITLHRHGEIDPGDYHWERRFIHSLDDFVRVADAPRQPFAFDAAAYVKGIQPRAHRGIPYIGLPHPLGRLVRTANMEEMYGWFLTEPAPIHRFLERANRQVIESILALAGRIPRPVFHTWALEMLVPPWVGMRVFDEFVAPYDTALNNAIHRVGGRHRCHCHGNSGAYLERFADMGIDALEPLEPPPYGDNDLANAKRRVGRRMLLSGNIPSQNYLRMSDADVREAVRRAIRDAAPGGGFSLRCSGGDGSTGSAKDMDQMRALIHKTEVYARTALELGSYPVRL